MANQDVINQGQAARELQNNEAFKMVTDALRKDIFDTWADASSADTNGREAMYFMHKALSKIDAKIKAMVDNGEMEKKILERDEVLRHKQVVALEEEVPE